MASVNVALFCEDAGHELFGRSMIRRICKESALESVIHTVVGRGGKGPALTHFKGYQTARKVGSISDRIPDLLVIMIDSNCQGARRNHDAISAVVDQQVFPRYVIATPEPHVERWCIADPTSFTQVIGVAPPRDPEKCDKSFYKTFLHKAIEAAGQPILTDAMEYAPEIVDNMDLYQAGKNQSALGQFVGDLRVAVANAKLSNPVE
jgi:hypothetical protein